MSWNYRIVNHGTYCDLREVYYDTHLRPRAYADESVTFHTIEEESPDDVKSAMIDALIDAHIYPIITLDDKGLISKDNPIVRKSFRKRIKAKWAIIKRVLSA